MTAPKGVEIGAVWIAKRGRRVPALVVSQIYRADRQIMGYFADSDSHRVVNWAELRRDYKPAR